MAAHQCFNESLNRLIRLREPIHSGMKHVTDAEFRTAY